MPVQQTIGIVEALAERMKLLDEDIASVEKEIFLAKRRNVANATGRVFPKIAAVFVAVVVGGILAIMVDGWVGLAVLAIGIGVAIKYKPEDRSIDVAPLESRLAELQELKQVREQEKRDLVLGLERQIRTETAPVDSNIEDQLVSADPDSKVCPMCAETVKAKARICKHCRHQFAEV